MTYSSRQPNIYLSVSDADKSYFTKFAVNDERNVGTCVKQIAQAEQVYEEIVDFSSGQMNNREIF